MTEYEEQLRDRLDALTLRKAQNVVDLPDSILAGLDFTLPDQTANETFIADCVSRKLLTASEAKRALTRIQKKLMRQCSADEDIDPVDFVKEASSDMAVRVTWSGGLYLNGKLNDPETLRRTMRLAALNAKVPFGPHAVNDATDHYLAELRDAVLPAMNAALADRQEFDWSRFVRTFFVETDTISYALTEAVLKKFVHQTRTKLAGGRVGYHLMPVFHGEQGTGKTYLIERMTDPLAEARTFSNFGAITDDRNVDLWKNLVIVLDEMSKANKACQETIKQVISAETLSRRPMRTNALVQVKNDATFIGASNLRLCELIVDTTGNRRFAEVLFQAPADRDVIKTFDFEAMWRSVQPEDEDPIVPFLDQLAASQAETVAVSRVRQWAIDTVFNKSVGYRANELWESYREWLGNNTVGNVIDTSLRFGKELTREIAAGGIPLNKTRDTVGVLYLPTDQTNVIAMGARRS